MTGLFRLSAAFLAMAAMLASPGAQAQDFPTKPIFFVVGPGPDTLARLFGQKMTEAWGQQVLVDPQPAAGGVVAARGVARAAPDGHTMLLTTGSYSIMQAMRQDLPFNILDSFAPVAEIGSLSFVLVVNKSLPVNSVDDLIKLARAKPGTINCASAGNGTPAHLGCEMFKKVAKIDIVHVPYRGLNAVMTDLLGGFVQMTFAVPTVIPQVKAGEVRALAVSGGQRLTALPDTPTLAETGLPAVEFSSWNGVHVPAGTPAAIVGKINAEVAKIRAMPDIQQRMIDLGFTPEGGTPAEFGQFVKRDVDRWINIVKETGVKPDP